MVIAAKKKPGRPKVWEHHKGYTYTNKKGTLVTVKAHKEKYSKN